MNSRIPILHVLGSLAYAGDLTMGQPIEHSPRVSLFAEKIAQSIDLAQADIDTVMIVALMRWSGCTANASEFAALFGDDVIGRARMLAFKLYDYDSGPAINFEQLHQQLPSLAGTHCEVGTQLASALQLGPEVVNAMQYLFELWGGGGIPGALSAEQVPLHTRIVTLAGDLEVLGRHYGHEAALKRIQAQMGGRYDPTLAAVTLTFGESWLNEICQLDPWPNLRDRNYYEHGKLGQSIDIDTALLVLADFADLKLLGNAGFSRQVAHLAKAACMRLGLSEQQSQQAEQAALLHGLGKAGVPSKILDSKTPLHEGAWEQIRLVPYWTERAVARMPEIQSIGKLASAVYERPDGSGYHRALKGNELDTQTTVLSTSLVFAALQSQRPWRTAMTRAKAINTLEQEVKAGHLDADAVRAVTGLPPKRSTDADTVNDNAVVLTERELDVIRELAIGKTNKEIAQTLGVSPKTISTHLGNIFRKFGVTTRAAATLHAVRCNLIG